MLTDLSEPLSRSRAARSDRRSLRAEKAQLQHWRRLLRARLDLAVGTFAPPEPLGSVDWETLPDAHHDLPDGAALAAAVSVGAAGDQVELMTRLRDLDRSLAAYGRALDDALETSTTHVVQDLALHAGDPRRASTENDPRAAVSTPPPALTGTDAGR
ncbi:hypothetical protein GXB85_10070 [Cellulomonas sp. APG4]|uniref:hypothetical protein n=1 Tax=Cellulomonas sp. APG4 TaxID=1538656 RepID=UPI001379A0CE|nr:hypothetical protein [Cellulomonas sp. APG4]NCT91295.1 hypothetical protein [Cellulomonas sp. APG4]